MYPLRFNVPTASIFFSGVSQLTPSTPEVFLPAFSVTRRTANSLPNTLGCEQALQGFYLAPPTRFRCLHDTHLKPAHLPVHMAPIDLAPVSRNVGRCTSGLLRHHLHCVLRPVGQILSCPGRKRLMPKRCCASRRRSGQGTVAGAVSLARAGLRCCFVFARDAFEVCAARSPVAGLLVFVFTVRSAVPTAISCVGSWAAWMQCCCGRQESVTGLRVLNDR